MICQQSAKRGGVQQFGSAIVAGQGQRTLLDAAIKAAMPDKVKDMPGTTAHIMLKVAPGLAL